MKENSVPYEWFESAMATSREHAVRAMKLKRRLEIMTDTVIEAAAMICSSCRADVTLVDQEFHRYGERDVPCRARRLYAFHRERCK